MKIPTFRVVIEQELLKRIGFFVRAMWTPYVRICALDRLNSAPPSIEELLDSMVLRVTVGMDIYEYIWEEESGPLYIKETAEGLYAGLDINLEFKDREVPWRTVIEYRAVSMSEVGESYMSFDVSVNKRWLHAKCWEAINN